MINIKLNMKKYILSIILILLSLSTYSQFSINYSIGYGTYKMDDMKDIAKATMDIANTMMGLKLKQTDDFPGYIAHNGEITYQSEQHEFGLSGAYITTGAKFAYSDYSGKYASKILADAFKIGFVYKYHFLETKISDNRFSVFAELTPSAVLTNVTIKEETRLYEQNIHQKKREELLSNKFGFSMQPMLGCRLMLFDHYLVHLKAGYDFELGSRINPSYRVDWSGFRLNGGIGYMF